MGKVNFYMAAKYIDYVVRDVLGDDVKRATKYIADNFVVTATRKCFGGKIDRRDATIDIILKIGRPNYAERKFIKLCKKSGEPFPIKKIQLKMI